MFTKFLSKLFIILGLTNYGALAVAGKPFITITQIAPHPSLDAIRQGIMDELKNQKQDIEIIFDNAQGNIALANQIAQKHASLNPTVMVSITTPSTQAVYNAALKHRIPVIFSAVSDPIAAKLIGPQSHPGITGVSDFAPVAQQLELILKIQPQIKKLGILYNAGEANSVALVAKFEELAKEKGIETVKKVAATTPEVATVTASFLGEVEAIYIPNDNTIISSLEAVLKAVNYKIPVYASDADSVRRGCLATVTFGQYQIGVETGKLVALILKGTLAESIPPVQMDKVEVLINEEVAKKLSLTIPQAFLPYLHKASTAAPTIKDIQKD